VTSMEDTVFLVKPHPMMEASFLSESIRKAGWSANYRVIEGSMDLWLSKSRVLVSAASATALEALAAGVPPVIVGSDTALDLNPLDWFDMDYARAFYEPGEIHRRIEQLKVMPEQKRMEMKEIGLGLLKDCFRPVSSEAMEAFLLR
jgi:hypothetical protein